LKTTTFGHLKNSRGSLVAVRALEEGLLEAASGSESVDAAADAITDAITNATTSIADAVSNSAPAITDATSAVVEQDIDGEAILVVGGSLAVLGLVGTAVSNIGKAIGSAAEATDGRSLKAMEVYAELCKSAKTNYVLVDIRTRSESRRDGEPDLSGAFNKVRTVRLQPSVRKSVSDTLSIARTFTTKFPDAGTAKDTSVYVLLDSDGRTAREVAKQTAGTKYVLGGSQSWVAEYRLPFKASNATVSEVVEEKVAETKDAATQYVAEMKTDPMKMAQAAGVVLAAGGAASGATVLANEVDLLLEVGLAGALAYTAANKVINAESREGFEEDVGGTMKMIGVPVKKAAAVVETAAETAVTKLADKQSTAAAKAPASKPSVTKVTLPPALAAEEAKIETEKKEEEASKIEAE